MWKIEKIPNDILFSILMEKGMATHSSILTWEIPWTEDRGAWQATVHGVTRVGLNHQNSHAWSKIALSNESCPGCKAVTRAAVSCSCPPFHCGWCNSGFIHQPPWIATSSSWRKTCCCRSGSAFACKRCPAKCSMARRLPTDGQPVDPVPDKFSGFSNYLCFTSLSCSKHNKFLWYVSVVLWNANGINWTVSHHRKSCFCRASIGHKL